MSQKQQNKQRDGQQRKLSRTLIPTLERCKLIKRLNKFYYNINHVSSRSAIPCKNQTGISTPVTKTSIYISVSTQTWLHTGPSSNLAATSLSKGITPLLEASVRAKPRPCLPFAYRHHPMARQCQSNGLATNVWWRGCTCRRYSPSSLFHTS